MLWGAGLELNAAAASGRCAATPSFGALGTCAKLGKAAAATPAPDCKRNARLFICSTSPRSSSNGPVDREPVPALIQRHEDYILALARSSELQRLSRYGLDPVLQFGSLRFEFG